MTMRVTILSTVMGQSGSLLAAGSTYTVGDQFGQELVRSGRATDTDRAMAVPQTELKPYFATDPLTGNVTGLVGPGGKLLLAANSTYLRKWRKALSGTLTGQANAKLLMVGDSTTAGLYAPSTPSYTNTPSNVMSRILNKSLVQTNTNSVHGDSTRNNPVAGFTTFDSRVGAVGFAAWNQTGFHTGGGNAFGNATTTTSLVFTPVEAFDTIDIYSIDNTGGYGQWTVNVDGGATLATVDNNGARAIRKTTVSCALATHAINIQRNGVGGQVFIIGICCRNSAVKTVDIYNIGQGGAITADWATVSGGVGELSSITAYAPDLTIIDLSINDRRLGLYTSTFDTNLQTIVTTAKATGDVILCTPAPSSLGYSAYTTESNIANFNAAIYAVAKANNCLVFDKQALLVSYAQAAAEGLYNDTLHPNAAGYGFIGQQMASLLLTA